MAKLLVPGLADVRPMTCARTFPSACVPAIAACALLAAPLAAQAGGARRDLFRSDGPTAFGSYGAAVARLDDVNGDGTPDFAVGAPGASTQTAIGTGVVYAVSGIDGSLLWQFDLNEQDAGLGTTLARVPDIDQDGVAELLAGAPGADPNGRTDAGSAVLLSGRFGTLLARYDGCGTAQQMGSALAGIEDLTGDGRADVLVGAPGAAGGGADAGAVYAFDGVSGALLFVIDGPTPMARMGASLAALRDVDLDGWPDLAAGAPGYEPTPGNANGAVFVFSSQTDAQLRRIDGVFFGDRIGAANSGRVWLVDAGSGFRHYFVDPALPAEAFGAQVAAPGDVDGDFAGDLLIGAPDAAPGGAAYLFSGRSGLPRLRCSGAAGEGLGTGVGGAGDVDHDGRADLALGRPGAVAGGRTDAGVVDVVAHDPFLRAGSEVLSASGGATFPYELDFADNEGGGNYAMLGGGTGIGPTVVQGVTIPLSNDPLFQFFATGHAPGAFQNPYGALNSGGNATVAFFAAANQASAFIGRRFYFAAVSFRPPRTVRLASVAVQLDILP